MKAAVHNSLIIALMSLAILSCSTTQTHQERGVKPSGPNWSEAPYFYDTKCDGAGPDANCESRICEGTEGVVTYGSQLERFKNCVTVATCKNKNRNKISAHCPGLHSHGGEVARRQRNARSAEIRAYALSVPEDDIQLARKKYDSIYIDIQAARGAKNVFYKKNIERIYCDTTDVSQRDVFKPTTGTDDYGSFIQFTLRDNKAKDVNCYVPAKHNDKIYETI